MISRFVVAIVVFLVGVVIQPAALTQAPPRRIVSLLPAATETLFALGAGDRVVGRTRYDEDPAVAHLPSVGGGLDPSLEALVALRPDLVLAWEPPGGSQASTRSGRSATSASRLGSSPPPTEGRCATAGSSS